MPRKTQLKVKKKTTTKRSGQNVKPWSRVTWEEDGEMCIAVNLGDSRGSSVCDEAEAED